MGVGEAVTHPAGHLGVDGRGGGEQRVRKAGMGWYEKWVGAATKREGAGNREDGIRSGAGHVGKTVRAEARRAGWEGRRGKKVMVLMAGAVVDQR